MSLTALLFSAVGETGAYRQAGIHKVQVAEFYQCWCFSATGGWPMGRARRARTRTRYLPEGFGKMSEMAILRH